MSFDKLLEGDRTKNQKFLEGELGDAQPVENVHALMENILEAEDAVKFLHLKKTWQKIEKTYNQISMGTKQAADDVIKHMESAPGRSSKKKRKNANKIRMPRLKFRR